MDEQRSDQSPELTTTISLPAKTLKGANIDAEGNSSVNQSSPTNLQRDLSAEDLAIIAQLADENAMLISLRGPGKGARFLIDQPLMKIGRDPANDIVLDDITVSRRHAHLFASGSQFFIKDQESLNGTYLNGQSIVEATLQSGDELQIGKYHLHFFTNRYKLESGN